MGVGNKGNDVWRKKRQTKPHKFSKKGEGASCGSQHYEKWNPSPSNFISIYIAKGNDVAVAYPHEMRQGYQSVKGGLIRYEDTLLHPCSINCTVEVTMIPDAKSRISYEALKY